MSDILAQTLGTIVELARSSVGARSFTPTSEPEQIYYLQNGGKDPVRTTAQPKNREHIANNVPALVESLMKLSRVSGEAGNPALIFYDADKVVGFLNEYARRDSIEMMVAYSDHYESMRQLVEAKPPRQFSQIELIRFFKNELYGCLGASGDLLAMVRSIKFNKTENSTGIISAGKASIGTALESEMTGVGQIPDHVVFDIPVFNNPEVQYRAQIVCSFDVDMQNGRFMIRPVPLTLEQATAEGEASIGQQIRDYATSNGYDEKKLLVFAGAP